jgi:hypothetical protein
MQIAPQPTGLAPTPEVIHWPAAKGVPSNRLPVKKAILAVQAPVAESAVRQALLGVLALAQARPVLVAA